MIAPLRRAAGLLAAVLLATPARSQPPLPPPDKSAAPKAEPGVTVLDRGPVHEAFAQPGADVRGKNITAPKAPPPPVPELPPEARPDGENVKWVPGYWLWDGDRKDFVWVSGFWRNVPPGREWQPGKWTTAKDGTHVYTPGFWRPADVGSWRVDLPEPPATVEAGPNAPNDNPDAIWVPGAWEFRNEKYAWRPGYWAKPYGELLWTPPQYLATAYGFTYVPGYWDYPLEDRGLLYAPVCFTSPLWNTPGWAYRPRFAVGVGVGTGWGGGGFFTSLYIGPGFNNYYFGNYGRPWSGGTWLGVGNPLWSPVFGFGGPLLGLNGYAGYVPWWVTKPGYPNPLWKNYCWLNRTNPAYPKSVSNAYVGRAFGVSNAPLPPVGAVAARPTAVAGALNTAARAAATNAARPAVPPPQTALVQPAARAAQATATARAARAATSPGLVAKPPANVGVGTRPTTIPGIADLPPLGRLSIQPPGGSSGAAAGNPFAGGTRPDPKSPSIVPGLQRGAPLDLRAPQTWTPGSGLQPLFRPGDLPGMSITPRNTTPFTPASPNPMRPGGSILPPPGTNSFPSVGRPAPNPTIRPPVVVGGNPAPRLALPPPQAAPIQRLPSAPSLPSIRPPIGGTGGGRIGPAGLPGGGGGRGGGKGGKG